MSLEIVKTYDLIFGRHTLYKQCNIPSSGAFRVYTDGSYKNSISEGASSFIILKDGVAVGKGTEICDYKKSVIAELNAVLLALQEIPSKSQIEVHTDCEEVAIFFFRLLFFRSQESMYEQYSDREVLPLIKKLAFFHERHSLKFIITERSHPLIRWCHNCANDISYLDTIEIDKLYNDSETATEELVFIKNLQTIGEPINNSLSLLLKDLNLKK